MRLWDAIRPREEQRYTTDDYANWIAQFGFAGLGGNVQQIEGVSPEFTGYATAAKSNGVIFACELVRMQVFSAIRFQFQRIVNGRPSELFGDQSLAALETPWAGGTTQDLLMRMIQDADLAGNSYWYRDGPELARLRPDWTSVILQKRPEGGYKKRGYYYEEPGKPDTAQAFFPEQVVHFAPIPDPLWSFRGMSWLTPVIRELTTDNQMNRHKQAFFANAATPNMAVTLHQDVKTDAFERFVASMERKYAGSDNAGKTMYLGGGADVTVIGNDFKQMDLANVQGHGETRIAAAAGVPPVIVGLSEGLAAATYSNYGQARRRFADGTAHPLWQNVAGSLQQIIKPPGGGGSGTRLWYDARDVPFLREDELDSANIKAQQAATINTLISAGFDPDVAVRAVMSGDFGLLAGAHTGLMSVQLQPPGKPVSTNPIALDKELAK
jgi:phage portal protein BeeE